MKILITALGLLFTLILRGNALAVPETMSVRVTDVTPTSFAVVWMTDVAAVPEVEIYLDAAMQEQLSEEVLLTPMADASAQVAAAAQQKGIMKIRATGLAPSTTYYARTVSKDPDAPASIGYSSLLEVTTAGIVKSYRQASGGGLLPLTNELMSFKVYIRPGDASLVRAQLDGVGRATASRWSADHLADYL